MPADEMADVRADKRAGIDKLVAEKNTYLEAHPRAKVETALNEVQAKPVPAKAGNRQIARRPEPVTLEPLQACSQPSEAAHRQLAYSAPPS